MQQSRTRLHGKDYSRLVYVRSNSQQGYSLHKSKRIRYPQRQRDLRAMTMSVGFLCSDGVVIGADRQVTKISSGYTFEEQKLGVLSVNGVVRHIWSYAGNADTAKKLARQLQTKLPTQSVSKKEAELLLRTALKKCLKPREHFYTLRGLCSQGRPCSLDGLRVGCPGNRAMRNHRDRGFATFTLFSRPSYQHSCCQYSSSLSHRGIYDCPSQEI
jgi:hypothetical protein